MAEALLNADQNCSDSDLIKELEIFNQKNATAFTFGELDSGGAKKKFLEVLLHRLEGKVSPQACLACMNTIRIISREKKGLEPLLSERALKIFMRHAGLEYYELQRDESVTIQHGDNDVIVESQKCLCNIIFNSQTAQQLCCKIGCLEGIVQRLKTYKDPDLSQQVKFFDMRLLFLLTALCSETRPRVVRELHGLTYLIEVLDLVLREADETADGCIRDDGVDLCCEVLKILFNITLVFDKNSLDEEDEAHCMRLVSVLHDILLAPLVTKDKKEELTSHAVNLLTNMPRVSYEELLTPVNESGNTNAVAASKVAAASVAASGGATAAGDEERKEEEYDGKSMEAVTVLLEFLSRRLDLPQQGLREGVTPILHSLSEICRGNRAIRKFCRIKVLPHLRDEVKQLPEEGSSYRNRLCRLFTNPVIEVKELAADFCFVLCKESVQRFVKYTGYGNAAGLLAQRGLMCGGRGADYSSESEDSETEEYSELKESVNPVTGRWEARRNDPMAGMSDEQKEFEAMQLVNQLDKLQRRGVIQPMRVDESGKPQPVEHILQLVNDQNLPDSNQNNDPDSD